MGACVAGDEPVDGLDVVVEQQHDLTGARSTPAWRAAASPAFSWKTGRSAGCVAASSRSSSYEPSSQPSTTTTTSVAAGSASSGASTRTSPSARWNVGMTTEIDGTGPDTLGTVDGDRDHGLSLATP